MTKKLTKAEQSERARIVDRLGELESQIDAMDPVIKESKQLTEQIASWAADMPAEQSAVFGGKKYTAIVSEKRNERTVNIEQLRKTIGDDHYLDIATIRLGDVDQLAKRIPSVATCVTSERTGKRTVATHPLAA